MRIVQFNPTNIMQYNQRIVHDLSVLNSGSVLILSQYLESDWKCAQLNLHRNVSLNEVW